MVRSGVLYLMQDDNTMYHFEAEHLETKKSDLSLLIRLIVQRLGSCLDFLKILRKS